ncbi:hypothetical protein EAE89_18770 [Photorhabdus heterorhabditis]|nr:hypothetical protein [Photorhabdus heterorhabditis]
MLITDLRARAAYTQADGAFHTSPDPVSRGLNLILLVPLSNSKHRVSLKTAPYIPALKLSFDHIS